MLMGRRKEYKDGHVYLPVFSFTEGSGELFFRSLDLNPDSIGHIPLGSLTAQLELFRIVENSPAGVESILDKADACLMLIKFLDQASASRIKEVFRMLGAEGFLPKSVALFRSAREGEFKISCTFCGQKLWIHDRDAGRRGSCPQCHKTFFIPTQKGFITSLLMLSEAIPVVTVVEGDASCRNAVASLVERIISMDEGLKSSTMRIELPPENGA